MIGTLSLVAGRVTSAQIRPYFVGTVTVSWTGSAARAAGARETTARTARAARAAARMEHETRGAPEAGALRDDGEVARDQPERRLGHVVDVIAVDLERQRPLVGRAHDEAVEVVKAVDAMVVEHPRPAREHAPDHRGHVDRARPLEDRRAQRPVV